MAYWDHHSQTSLRSDDSNLIAHVSKQRSRYQPDSGLGEKKETALLLSFSYPSLGCLASAQNHVVALWPSSETSHRAGTLSQEPPHSAQIGIALFHDVCRAWAACTPCIACHPRHVRMHRLSLWFPASSAGWASAHSGGMRCSTVARLSAAVCSEIALDRMVADKLALRKALMKKDLLWIWDIIRCSGFY